MARHKDSSYDFPDKLTNTDHVTWTLLMDLRDEAKKTNELLQRLVNVLECSNTFTIPHTLKRIDKRLAKQLPLKEYRP